MTIAVCTDERSAPFDKAWSRDVFLAVQDLWGVDALPIAIDQRTYVYNDDFYQTIERLYEELGSEAVSTAPELIDLLAKKDDSRSRNLAVHGLKTVSGEDYGRDLAAWVRWMRENTDFVVPPLDLHIETTDQFDTGGDEFSASGSAVVAGFICPSGTVDDLSVLVKDDTASDHSTLRVLKRFTCANTGSFDMDMVVQLDLATNETSANWEIISGTGDYASLSGSGSLVGTPVDPGISILDVYDGSVQ
jgi:hypothetical protein